MWNFPVPMAMFWREKHAKFEEWRYHDIIIISSSNSLCDWSRGVKTFISELCFIMWGLDLAKINNTYTFRTALLKFITASILSLIVFTMFHRINGFSGSAQLLKSKNSGRPSYNTSFCPMLTWRNMLLKIFNIITCLWTKHSYTCIDQGTNWQKDETELPWKEFH